MDKIRILIFDDEEMIRKTLKIALSDKNCEILEFSNPTLCPSQKIEACPCPENTMCADIIITDIRMPLLNGLDFIRQQKEKGCKVQNILIISAYIDEKVVTEMAKMEVKFLQKPFHIDKFLKIIDEFEKNVNPDRKLNKWD